ncbi:cytochrome P450 2B4-like [Ptychodera flava]|uniref:cytochrome P450 2B4-like n=1 Tax=Ptychodera flava TaxID=63121 RepID=UPI00396A2A48
MEFEDSPDFATSVEIMEFFYDINRLEVLSLLLIITVLVLLIFNLYQDFVPFSWNNRKGRLPPGPRGYPLVGCLPSVDDKLPMTMMRWAEQYGDVFSVRFGTQTFVVLNSFDVHREALRKPELADRPTYSLLRMILGNRGIACQQYNRTWREQRNFVVETFHRCLGNKTIEDRIRAEAAAMCDALRENSTQPIDVSFYLRDAVGNVISSLCFGQRFRYDDPTFRHLIQMFHDFSQNVASTSIIDFFPFLRHFSSPIFKRIYDPYDSILTYAKQEIERHRQVLDMEAPNDFIDAFLARMERDRLSGTRSSFTDENLSQGVFELFFGGINTTFYSLTWAIFYTVVFPEIQRKIHQEMDEVLDSDEMPFTSDKKKLPYTNATLKEIYRHATVAWMGGPHEASQDVSFRGYTIPKGTTVFMNLLSVHYDPKYWQNPEEFRPERFLDENGNVNEPEAYIPFSMGCRECMGKNLANTSSFLFFATLLKTFTFEAIDHVPKLSDGKFGPVHFPPNYKVKISIRK